LIRTILRDDQWQRIAPELPGKAGDPAPPHGTIGCLSKRFCGSHELGHRGVTCRTNSASGSPPTRGFGAGRERACGSAFSKSWRTIPISNTSFSMRRTSGSTSMEPAQKGDSQSGHWQIPRRSDHEDCSARRCARQSGSLCIFDQPQAADDAASAFHWNVVPVVHMRCRMTASLRATAIVAFLAPMRLPRASPSLQCAGPRRLTEQHFGCFEQKTTYHDVSALGDTPGVIDLARLITPGRHPEVRRHRR
jgi:hypothetical protein